MFELKLGSRMLGVSPGKMAKSIEAIMYATLERYREQMVAVLEKSPPTPVDKGCLRTALTASERPKRLASGQWTVGIGDKRRMGMGVSAGSAPRGTIKAFLEARRGRPSRNSTPKRRWFDPKYAWWFLKPEEKEALSEAREGGQFGGQLYRGHQPRYWWLQETGRYPAPYGGKAAGYLANAHAKQYEIVEKLLAKARDDVVASGRAMQSSVYWG